MRFLFFSFIYLTWSGAIFSSFSSIPEEIAVDPTTYFTVSTVPEPIFSRASSLVADPSHSFISTVLNLFYSVPKIQKAFYAEADAILSTCPDEESRKEKLKTSLIVATAGVFAHMRMANEPLRLDSFYLDALRSAYGESLNGQFVSLAQFLKGFFERLTARITFVFQHQSLITIRASHSTCSKTRRIESMSVKFPLYKNNLSIDQYIRNSANEPMFIKIGSEGTHFSGVKFTSFVEIVSTPEVLLFNIPRITLSDGASQIKFFVAEKIIIDIKITVNRVNYVLMGFSTFDTKLMKYSSVTRDIGNQAWYQMIDGKTSYPLNQFPLNCLEDENSVLLVYVREDSLFLTNQEAIKTFSDIPASVKSALKSFMTPVSIEQQPTKVINEHLQSDRQIIVNGSNGLTDSDFNELSRTFEAYSDINNSEEVALIPTEVPAETTSEIPFAINPETSLISPTSSSCIAAILNAFYNIPGLQKAFYKDAIQILSTSDNGDISVNVAFAAAFAQMKLKGGRVSVEDYIIEAISKEDTMSQYYVLFVRFSPFFNVLSKLLGQNVKDQLEIDSEVKAFKADSTQIGMSFKKSVSFVTLPFGANPRSVSYFLLNDLADPTKLTRSFNSKTSQYVDIYLSIKIINSPKYLCFDISRIIYENPNSVQSKLMMANNPIIIDSEVEVNGIAYILVARMEFNINTATYSTIVKDFRTSNLYHFHHDGTVQVLQNTAAASFVDSNSTFLIYAEKKNFFESYLNENESAEDAKFILNKFEELHKQKSSTNKKRKFEEIQGEVQSQIQEEIRNPPALEYYKPDYSNLPEAIRSHFPAVESRLLELQANNVPFEALNFMSKALYGTYLLGKEDYSFKQSSDGKNSNFLGLELLLPQMASSIHFVTALFKYLTKNPQSRLELVLAVVISRMLLGCKNITLNHLMDEIVIKSKRPASFFKCGHLHVLSLNAILRTIMGLIHPSLVSLPSVKIVEYDGLSTNDPGKVYSQVLHSVNESKIISPLPADIRGAWFDSKEKKADKRRTRTIYKSTSEILPIEIYRSSPIPISIEAQSMDRNVDGFICVSSSNLFYSYALDKFSGKYRGLIPGGQAISIDCRNEEHVKIINSYKLNASIQIFMSFKTDQIRRVYSNMIPRPIIELAFKQILAESSPESNLNKEK